MSRPKLTPEEKQLRAQFESARWARKRADMLAEGWVQVGVGNIVQGSMAAAYPREKMQVPKRQTSFTYVDGPMMYLGQQIVKQMQDAGYPAKILYCYRSPEQQRELYSKGRDRPGRRVTNAPPWHSPHQYSEAVDIIHPSLGWDVSEDYWAALASCVKIVSERFGVALVHGHYWRFRDSAHIETPDWRIVKAQHERKVLSISDPRPPNSSELWARFEYLLPDVAKAYMQTGAGVTHATHAKGGCPFAWVDSILQKLGLK